MTEVQERQHYADSIISALIKNALPSDSSVGSLISGNVAITGKLAEEAGKAARSLADKCTLRACPV